MSEPRPLRPSRHVWIVLILLSAVVISGRILISGFVGNIGLLLLVHSFASSDLLELRINNSDVSGQEQAQHWLQAAVALNHGNRGAIRGLGFALASQGRESEALATWRDAEAPTDLFITRGNLARATGRFETALKWYQRANALPAAGSDGWYYEGLTYGMLGQWDSARRAHEQAITLNSFDAVGRSSPYYRLGVIYQQHTQPPRLDKALNAYNIAVALNDFTQVSEAADSYYKRGIIYEAQGRDPKYALPEYQQAAALNSKHHWAHLKLGITLYQVDKDISAAEQEIERALEVWPADTSRKWPYRYLGDMYREAGLPAQAEVAYREALSWDPQDAQVKSSLAKLNQHD
jgi:tetratricopeptide (TPR) repeat protein